MADKLDYQALIDIPTRKGEAGSESTGRSNRPLSEWIGEMLERAPHDTQHAYDLYRVMCEAQEDESELSRLRERERVLESTIRWALAFEDLSEAGLHNLWAALEAKP